MAFQSESGLQSPISKRGLQRPGFCPSPTITTNTVPLKFSTYLYVRSPSTGSIATPCSISTDISLSEISIASDASVDLPWHALPFGSGFCVPDTYCVPTRYLQDIFRGLELRESQSQKDMAKYSSIAEGISRFHRVFDGHSEERIADAIGKLETQAQRHAKSSNTELNDALVRWKQGVVMNNFSLKLSLVERIFFTCDIRENSTLASKAVSSIVMLSVFVSTITFVLGTVPSARKSVKHWIPTVDLTCVCIFTLDFITRLVTVVHARAELLDRRFLEEVLLGQRTCQHTPAKRLAGILISPAGLIDILSVVPFWVQLGMQGMDSLVEDDTIEGQRSHASLFRILQIVRISRIFKLTAVTKADLGEDQNMVLKLFVAVVKQAAPALQLVCFLILMAMLVFGSLIWVTERGDLFLKDDPKCPLASLCTSGPVRLRLLPDGSYEMSPSQFSSIPLSFWWVLVTITTVGYGDYYPVTQAGYLIGCITILYGAVIFTIPIGVIGTTFSKQYEQFLEESLHHEARDEAKATDLSPPVSKNEDEKPAVSVLNSGPPLLVVEFKHALRQIAIAADIKHNILARWEKRFETTIRFEGLPRERPSEVLERWGACVFTTLREHITADSEEAAALAKATSAWYRLLVHAAMVYEETSAILPWNRTLFDNAWQSHARYSVAEEAYRLSSVAPPFGFRMSQSSRKHESEDDAIKGSEPLSRGEHGLEVQKKQIHDTIPGDGAVSEVASSNAATVIILSTPRLSPTLATPPVSPDPTPIEIGATRKH
eukprot:TRINITY_DN44404_c0_g1_i1.p1 TRINITY_DN44404_c0_g1~~TRINITY_DN44404_c0_g1_i1.p1  ORF type:complete len:785 (-),score=89.05 TRINITY_DN44404_c0_g1_i1:84-2399(-)